MTDPLLPLLATIERLDREATRGPWERGKPADAVVAAPAEDDKDDEHLHHYGGRLVCESMQDRDRRFVIRARSTLAPLASMLRVAVEALEPFARYAEKMKPGPLPDTACVAVHHDNVNGDTEITIADLRRARAALATIRRMAEEVSR